MLIDANGPERAQLDRAFDLCVIGAGPAGITLARRAAAQGLSVALMEAGGREITAESQEVYEGEVGRARLLAARGLQRLRYLGGSSGHWGGWCRSARRRWTSRPRPGTPERLADRPGGPRPLRAPRPTPSSTCRRSRRTPAPVDGFREVFFRFSDPPINFRDKYAGEIEASDRITLGLNANLVDLRLTSDLGEVSGGGVPRLDYWRPGLHGAGAGLCAVLRRDREPAAAAELRQPGDGGASATAPTWWGGSSPSIRISSLAEAMFRAIRRPSRSCGSSPPTEAFIDAEQVLNFGLRLERMPVPIVGQPGRSPASRPATTPSCCGWPRRWRR